MPTGARYGNLVYLIGGGIPCHDLFNVEAPGWHQLLYVFRFTGNALEIFAAHRVAVKGGVE